VAKIVDAMPQQVRDFWPFEDTPPATDAGRGQGLRPNEAA
jgi:hypothetical protein